MQLPEKYKAKFVLLVFSSPEVFYCIFSIPVYPIFNIKYSASTHFSQRPLLYTYCFFLALDLMAEYHLRQGMLA